MKKNCGNKHMGYFKCCISHDLIKFYHIICWSTISKYCYYNIEKTFVWIHHILNDALWNAHIVFQYETILEQNNGSAPNLHKYAWIGVDEQKIINTNLALMFVSQNFDMFIYIFGDFVGHRISIQLKECWMTIKGDKKNLATW